VLIKEFRLALSVVLVKALCKVWLKKVLWASWIKSKLKVYKMPTAKLQGCVPSRSCAQTGDQAARAAEAARVQQMTESGNQFAANQGIAALGAGAAGAQALAGYGQLGRESDIQNAQLLETIGRSNQAEGQQGLDLGYQEYLTKQGFTQNQIANMSNMLQGLPVANAGTSSGTTNTVGTPATPGFGQQVLGAGLTGLSLYKAFKDGGLVR
jgi:hypothetical protein